MSQPTQNIAYDGKPVLDTRPLPVFLSNAAGTSSELTLTVTVATGAGTVAAGAKQVGFAVTGAAAATIAGASVPAGTSFSVDAPGGTTIDAVTYDATGTTLVITRLA
jgi:hypothetical protein